MIGLLLVALILWLVPSLLGMLMKRMGQLMHLSQENDAQRIDMPAIYLQGVFLMICIFEVVVVASMKFDIAFSKVIILFSVLLLIICGLTCTLCFRQLKEVFLPFPMRQSTSSNDKWELKKSKKTEKIVYYVLFFVMFAIQILLILHFAPVTGDDNTMELVQTTLSTDTIGMVNPLTGRAYATGLTLQGKLLNLPLFYAYLTRICSVNPALLIYCAIPIWVLMMAYCACRTIDRRPLFMVCYGTLLTFGGYLFTTPGFQLLHGGWKGETIVVTVLIPFLLGRIMRIREKNNRKIIVAQCLLGAATVVPLMRWRKGITYLFCMIVIIAIIVLGNVVSHQLRRRKGTV